MTTLFSVRNLTLPTGQHVSMHLGRGEIHGLTGPSGTGKTRLLRALANLDEVSADLRLHHKPLGNYQATEWRRRVMLVPTDSRWWLPTAAEHMHKDMHDAAEKLGLTPARMHAPVTQLSTGEKARCALLRALSYEPEVLLLDEPTAALDHENVHAVEALIKGFSRDHAVLWITHDELQAERVADHRWQLTASQLIRVH